MAAVDQQQLLRLLAKERRYVLTTHINPDGDALGSQLALADLIRRLSGDDAEVRIVNRDPVPSMLEFLAGSRCVETYDPSRHDHVFAAADVIFGVDNSDPARLGEVAGAIRGSRALRVCIDHHPEPDSFWDMLHVDVDACCTAELVHGLYRTRGIEPGPEIATALYVALFSDTGRFRFSNTDAAAFMMAAELVRSGASPALAYNQLEERLSADYIRFAGRVLAGATTHADGRVMVLRATRSMIEEHSLEGVDLGEIINLTLRGERTRVTALFRELDANRTKVSLRSKGALDVNTLARRHGGGGHRNASGVLLERPLDGAVGQLLGDMEALACETA